MNALGHSPGAKNVKQRQILPVWAKFDAYSVRRQQKRRKTQRAFLLSLTLHAIAIAIMGLGYIRWYRPPVPSEPLVSEAIAVTNLEHFHISSLRKRTMAYPTVNACQDLAHAQPKRCETGGAQFLQPHLTCQFRCYKRGARLPMEETSLHKQRTEIPSVENDCGCACPSPPQSRLKPELHSNTNQKTVSVQRSRLTEMRGWGKHWKVLQKVSPIGKTSA